MKGKLIRTEIERHIYSNGEAGHEIVGIFTVDGIENEIRVSFGAFNRRYSSKWQRIIELYGEMFGAESQETGAISFDFEKKGNKILLCDKDKEAITDLIYKEKFYNYYNLHLVFKDIKEENISIEKLRSVIKSDFRKTIGI